MRSDPQLIEIKVSIASDITLWQAIKFRIAGIPFLRTIEKHLKASLRHK